MSHYLNLYRDPVDEALKADAQERRAQHIDDDGFTLRTMDTLPPSRRVSALLRFAIPFGCTLLACVIAVAFTSTGSLIFDAYMDLVTETVTPTLVGVAVVLVTFYGVSIGSALNDG
jgi:hypothetical protein